MSVSYKIHYFPGYGRAEAIRMLLSHAGIEYEEVNYGFGDMPSLKESGKLEFGQLPAVERDGKFYVQSTACLRALGINLGYYPEDPYQAYLVDSAIDSVNDILSAFYKAAFNPSEEAKAGLFTEFYGNTLPRYFSAFEKRLEGNTSGFLVGDKITIADFALAALAYSSFLNENNPNRQQPLEVVEKFPNFKKYTEGLKDHIKTHLETRKPSPW